VTPREGDETKILTYKKNILAAMAPNVNGFDFSIFDFIWEEIKAISENPLKSCAYAPHLMHMIGKVTTRTFFCKKVHHPLTDQEGFESSSRGVKSSGTTFFTS
jgi:hypothetical protein